MQNAHAPSVRSLAVWLIASGPVALPASLAVGFLVPGLSDLAYQGMGLALFVLLATSIAALDGRGLSGVPAWQLGFFVVGCCGVQPLLVTGLDRLLPLDPEARLALLLLALSPPAAAAAALTRMANGADALVLAACLAASLASPLYVPPALASLAGSGLDASGWAMAQRLGAIVVPAAVLALSVRRVCPSAVERLRSELRASAILALVVISLGRMHGSLALALAEPVRFAGALGLAVAAAAGMGGLGWLALRSAGASAAIGGLYGASVRNVTLVWTATGALPPMVEVVLGLAAVPGFLAPYAILLAPRLWRERARALTS